MFHFFFLISGQQDLFGEATKGKRKQLTRNGSTETSSQIIAKHQLSS